MTAIGCWLLTGRLGIAALRDATIETFV